MHPQRRVDNERRWELSNAIIGAAIEVHRLLGPGLLESTYEECLCRELELRRIPFRRQVELPVRYKGLSLACAYRMDIVADDTLVIEVKAIAHLQPVHEAQLLTYLRMTGYRIGLLINFHTNYLRNGVLRKVL